MRLVLAAVLLSALSACGGSSGPTYESAEDVADAAVCRDIDLVEPADQEMFVADQLSCTLSDGGVVTIVWFRNDGTFKNWRKVAEQMSGSDILYGNRWAVECSESKEDCQAFADLT